MKTTLSESELVKLYCEARSDYRNSLNMEQTILSFGVTILAVGTAAGFASYGSMLSWIIFCLLLPFLLSPVKFIYLHQKHRSKTYKVYQKYIEDILLDNHIDFPGFELWKNKVITRFVNKRRGFYITYVSVLMIVPYFFIAIGLISYTPIDKLLLLFLALVFALSILVDVICIKYLLSISKLLKAPSYSAVKTKTQIIIK